MESINEPINLLKNDINLKNLIILFSNIASKLFLLIIKDLLFSIAS
jgi:hypothetical protein